MLRCMLGVCALCTRPVYAVYALVYANLENLAIISVSKCTFRPRTA